MADDKQNLDQINRREFLGSGCQLLLSLQLFGITSYANAKTTVAPSYLISPMRRGTWQKKYVGDEPVWVAHEWGMAVFDMTKNKTKIIETPAIGHSVVGNPVERHKILFISQKPGTLCCEIDLLQGKITKTFSSAPGVFFIGHAAFSKDGKWAYFTEAQYGSTGFITRRNTKDYAVDKIFPSGGLEPHELRLIDDDKTIVVANGGIKSLPNSMTPEDPGNAHPSITHLSTLDGKIIKTLTDFEPQMSARHITFGDEDETFIGLRRFVKKEKEQSPLVVASRNKIETFKGPDAEIAKMKSWLQSLAYSKVSGIIAASAPDGNCVTFWNAKTRQFVKTIDLMGADGLTLTVDQKHFIATSHKGKVLVVDATTLKIVDGPWQSVTRLNWRHCLAWKLQA